MSGTSLCVLKSWASIPRELYWLVNQIFYHSWATDSCWNDAAEAIRRALLMWGHTVNIMFPSTIQELNIEQYWLKLLISPVFLHCKQLLITQNVSVCHFNTFFSLHGLPSLFLWMKISACGVTSSDNSSTVQFPLWHLDLTVSLVLFHFYMLLF